MDSNTVNCSSVHDVEQSAASTTTRTTNGGGLEDVDATGGGSSGDYVAMATLEMEPSASSSIMRSNTNKSTTESTSDAAEMSSSSKSYNYYSFFIINDEIQTTLVQICYLSIFAILGCFVRIIIAQLFGEECQHPNTIGWLKSSSPLCITKNGNTEFEGGIIFADLPSNLLGSFIMGMLQSGTTLGLPINCQLAFVNSKHILQSLPILHLALRTGFCGSLTTYSSWNTEMIVMIFGTGDSDKYGKSVHLLNEIIKALFGYLIGIETALGSFEFGKTCALWANKCADPLIHDEMIALREKQEQGIYHNKDLPNFERRFLPNLNMDILGGNERDGSVGCTVCPSTVSVLAR